jgi:hypothetical protein
MQLWWVHKGAEGSSQELWQSLRCWLWLAPNSIRAICKVTVAESRLLRALVGCFLKKEVRGTARRLLLLQVASCRLLALAHQAVVMRVCQPGPRPASCPAADPPALPRPPLAAQINFKVTQKGADKKGFDWVGISWCWPYLAFYLAYAAAIVFFVATAIQGWYNAQQLLLNAASVLWGALICISFWPPVAGLLPRAEEEQGWQVLWKPLAGTARAWRLPAAAAGPAGGKDAAVSALSGGRGGGAKRPADNSADQFVLLPHYPEGAGAEEQTSKARLFAVDAKALGKAPAEQLQYTVGSVPSFEQRQKPQRTLAFQLISLGMVACLVVAAVMDLLIGTKAIDLGP